MGSRSFVTEENQAAEAVRDIARDEAAAWLLRLHSRPTDAELEAEFQEWLARDPVHRQAWEAAQRAWSLAGVVGPSVPGLPAGRKDRDFAQDTQPSRGWRDARPSQRSGQSRRGLIKWVGGVAAATLVCGLALQFSSLQARLQADYSTGVGETRTVELADGSLVELDSDSAISVDYRADRRMTRLLTGQAYFTVKHGPDRPFAVQAGDVAVTVTGTEFDVRMSGEDISVAVADGRVLVGASHDGKPGSALGDEVLVAGQAIRINRTNGAATLSAVSANAIASWRRGRLLVETATIGELAETLGRYYSGSIIVLGEKFSHLPVTGVFDLSDPIRALKTVVHSHSGQVRQITPWLVVVSAG